MKKIFIVAAIFSICLFSAKAAMAVPFGDAGVALQVVLDDIATDSSNDVTAATDELADAFDSIWSVGGSGGAISTIIVELASFAGTNTFGVYDAADPTNTVELFAGSDGAGDQVLLSILGNGSVIVSFTDSGIDFAGNAFGFYLDSSTSVGGGTWFSDTSLNSDSMDHMAAYQGVGEEIEIPPFAPGLWGSNEWILAWEDLDNDIFSDRDFTDFVVLVESVNPVPEPGTIALLGIGLAGLVGVGVRRRAKKNAA